MAGADERQNLLPRPEALQQTSVSRQQAVFAAREIAIQNSPLHAPLGDAALGDEESRTFGIGERLHFSRIAQA